jgi:hypothetical protein
MVQGLTLTNLRYSPVGTEAQDILGLIYIGEGRSGLQRYTLWQLASIVQRLDW